MNIQGLKRPNPGKAGPSAMRGWRDHYRGKRFGRGLKCCALLAAMISQNIIHAQAAGRAPAVYETAESILALPPEITRHYHRVRIAGTVTYFKPGDSLIVEDRGKALFLATLQGGDIKLGDRIEAVGFPAPQDSGPVLQDAVLRVVASGQELQPKPVRISDLSSGAFNYNLISTQGSLLRRVHEPFREVLLIQDESNLLLAEVLDSERSDVLKNLLEGSKSRLRGSACSK